MNNLAEPHEEEGMAKVALQRQSSETHLARPLKVLVQLIREDIASAEQAAQEAAEQAAKPWYLSAGEKLCEAKVHFPKKTYFYEWATREFGKSETAIRNWVRYAEEEHGGEPQYYLEDTTPLRAEAPQQKEYKTLSEVTDARPPGHRPAWHEPVQKVTNRINFKVLAQEQQEKKKEEKLCHQLAMQLIDIGYKVLASKLHPDKPGGSREAMVRLNKVRDILKGAV